MKRNLVFGAGLLIGAVAPHRAFAHVCNVVLSNPATTTVCGDPDDPTNVNSFTPTVQPDGSVTFEDGAFTPFGWLSGTVPTLGDSHELDGGNFYVFELRRASDVTITFANDPAINPSPFDTAFSLYEGWLPDLSHDDEPFDPLNPVDEVTFLPVASPTDTAPSPRHHYTPLDRFRDTLHYSQTGGVDASGNPIHPFTGQFNALNDFSMANEDAVPGEPANGNWATIKFITHQNYFGPGRAESVTLHLRAGKYTIAAGGANCAAASDGAACGATGFYSGIVRLKVR